MPSSEDREMNAEYRKVQSDAKFMADPDRWPNWPVLPVVEREGDKRPGIVIEQSRSDKPKVWVGAIMWQLKSGQALGPQLDAMSTEVKVYESFEALAAQWRID